MSAHHGFFFVDELVLEVEPFVQVIQRYLVALEVVVEVEIACWVLDILDVLVSEELLLELLLDPVEIVLLVAIDDSIQISVVFVARVVVKLVVWVHEALQQVAVGVLLVAQVQVLLVHELLGMAHPISHHALYLLDFVLIQLHFDVVHVLHLPLAVIFVGACASCVVALPLRLPLVLIVQCGQLVQI